MTKRGTPPRMTDVEYAELAADYEANPITTDEILSAEVNPAFLPTGRPTKAAGKGGKTQGDFTERKNSVGGQHKQFAPCVFGLAARPVVPFVGQPSLTKADITAHATHKSPTFGHGVERVNDSTAHDAEISRVQRNFNWRQRSH